jgi:hypothetical protein
MIGNVIIVVGLMGLAITNVSYNANFFSITWLVIATIISTTQVINIFEGVMD